MNGKASFGLQDFINYNSYLKGFAYKLTQDWHRAEDLFQETAFLAFKNQDKYKAGTNLRAWLTTIMRNTFINDLRKRRRSILNDQEDWMDYLDVRSVDNQAETQLNVGEINRLVQDLAPIYREPFLYYMMGYKYREIAKQLDLPLGTIKSRIHIARKQLISGLQSIQFV